MVSSELLLTISISIHSLPKEGDNGGGLQVGVNTDFNPLPPQGGRPYVNDACASSFDISIHSLPKEGDTRWIDNDANEIKFQSTPSPRRETLTAAAMGENSTISIHSLPKEGDNSKTNSTQFFQYFNPLPPQGGRLDGESVRISTGSKFQSTPSPRRETTEYSMRSWNKADFNPLPPQGGRQLLCPICRSIHGFQSTPSPRRETMFRFLFQFQ